MSINNWIPVRQGTFPEEFEPVLVFYTYEIDEELQGEIGITYLLNYYYPGGLWKPIEDRKIEVYYWQPLPDYPEEFSHLQ